MVTCLIVKGFDLKSKKSWFNSNRSLMMNLFNIYDLVLTNILASPLDQFGHYDDDDLIEVFDTIADNIFPASFNYILDEVLS
jgi:hypothetical protein